MNSSLRLTTHVAFSVLAAVTLLTSCTDEEAWVPRSGDSAPQPPSALDGEAENSNSHAPRPADDVRDRGYAGEDDADPTAPPTTIQYRGGEHWTPIQPFDPDHPKVGGRFSEGWQAARPLVPAADYHRTEFFKDSNGFVHIRGPVLTESALAERWLGTGSGPWQSQVFSLPECARPAHLAAAPAVFIDLFGEEFSAGGIAVDRHGAVRVVWKTPPPRLTAEGDRVSITALIDGWSFEAAPDSPPCDA